ncbi:uncharacterized protein LOC127244107 [Andrographis paniculata]|uniref:uncharacterized protein LOC127244107 n=1 Tax=Andrographis paniculata TaxID=175694 RepID=UPI0021E7917C|nr:uncharacterized protein LOC127244107 [Andrographis paniculata]
MSDVALRDVSKVPEPERLNGIPNIGNMMKPSAEAINENTGEKQRKTMDSLVDISIEKNGTKDSGPEVANSEVEYIDSKDLKDVEDVEDCLKKLLSELGSKDWVSVCEALNNVRRLSIFHEESTAGMLGDIISLVVKSLKNPRSAVCKTAIMASVDIFKVYNDGIIDSVDPLLVQLLLKSSQDKRFVCEAADNALIALTSSVSPLLLLPKLQPYVKNRNPRIRAKASMCISRSVQRMGPDEIKAFGIDQLVQVGASQLSDQLPGSRDAARTLLLDLQSIYEKLHTDSSDGHPAESWEEFCQSKLSPLSAQAVLRVSNNAREGLVSGS